MRQKKTSSHQIHFSRCHCEAVGKKATDTLIVIQQLLMAQLGNVEQLVHEPKCLHQKTKQLSTVIQGLAVLAFTFPMQIVHLQFIDSWHDIRNMCCQITLK